MNILPAQYNASATSPYAAQQTKSAFASSDFETFLKMLTVQMQNQDPMNPIDSADYAVQLATFSGVEQAVRTNQLLESLQSQFGMLGMAQLAAWVGQEARAAAPVFVDGTPVTLSPNPVAAADRAVLVVRDSQGRVVSREDIPVSADPYEWHGTDATGAALPNGQYTVFLESYYAGEVLRVTPVEYYAPIVEARGGAGGTRLVLRGGIEVLATDITALRVPPNGARDQAVPRTGT
ncbi:MAG: flagellar hook capping FlgD N-terminal domain-containing protein [Pseudotabrizicola sp.]|uniref:flagellar hook capping FlgD N-terminal domain-containing protein n=1 Tax=Pseudotabrizicola sp. TaxID=2939647 RepID=UPI00272F96CB|nr:flagellar hook capping FlgD N-terminal domain-containing protein [Pseudotabrizicola sp.]MDP2082505.1 flagellar hook capping FlgD N-terminal domain-containing protein [Pseudotabrizicola sp.]MDZ7572811.1 flagellar hook capping FlgD N-terminal domain-containing protein [Pseudotabrizicola sp.]